MRILRKHAMQRQKDCLCVCPCLLCCEACHWAPSQTLVGYRSMASRSACNSLGRTLLMCICAWLCAYVYAAWMWLKRICSQQGCQQYSVSQTESKDNPKEWHNEHFIDPGRMSPWITGRWWNIILDPYRVKLPIGGTLCFLCVITT